jgi:hypothetical protein
MSFLFPSFPSVERLGVVSLKWIVVNCHNMISVKVEVTADLLTEKVNFHPFFISPTFIIAYLTISIDY